MNKKITLTLVSIAIFSNLALAQGIGSPGLSTNSDGSATQEIELNRGWNNIAVNVEGATLSEAASEGTCNFEGSGHEVGQYESFAFRTDNSESGFAPVSLGEELDPSVGYTVGVLESCSLVFSGDEALSYSNERTLHGQQWNLVTLPDGFSPNDLKNIVENNGGSELATYDGEYFHVHEGQDNGQEVWTYPSSSLANHKSVWVGVLGESITVDFASESIGDPGPGTGDPSDGSDDGSDGSNHDHTLGDLYFWDTEASRGIVNTEAGNNYEGQKVEYNMYDGDVEGSFTWKNNDRVEHTLWVKNEHSGRTQQTTSSSVYVSVPERDGGTTWGTGQYGVNNMANSGCTEFTVAVLPPGWDGSDSDVSGDAEQMNQFTFCPNSQGDDSDDSDDTVDESPSDCDEDEYYDHGFNQCLPDSDDSDSGSDELDPNEVEWTLNPPPSEWESYGSNNEVDIEVTARTGGGDITGYRIWADLNHGAWVNDPNPWSYVCNEGGSEEWTTCHADHTHDPYPSEWGTYEVTGKLQEETCEMVERRSRGYTYETEECSWNTIDQHTWDDFPYDESSWGGWY